MQTIQSISTATTKSHFADGTLRSAAVESTKPGKQLFTVSTQDIKCDQAEEEVKQVLQPTQNSNHLPKGKGVRRGSQKGFKSS
jgi:hypothetical protein